MSFFARWFWLADLFSHFLLQYIVGSLVLLLVAVLLKSKTYIVSNALVLLVCFIELLLLPSVNMTKNASDKPVLSILQFNKLVSNQNNLEIINWISNQDEPFDLIAIQEANKNFELYAEELKKIYPYQIIETREHAFGMHVLSKYDFLDVEKISVLGPVFENFYFKITIKPSGFEESVDIFPLHAVPPTGKAYWEQRNLEIRQVLNEIGDSKGRNTIFMGDWNLSPYSPFFIDILKFANLKIATTRIFPDPTWPSKLHIDFLNIFQIPIDHILFSDNLVPLNKRVDKAMGSDHHPVIMDFIEKSN